MSIRVYQLVSGQLVNLTSRLANYYNGDVTLNLQSSQYLYVGQELPFNSFYVKTGSIPNAVAATMSYDIWAGRGPGWTSVAELIDGTSLSGASMGQSGHVEFVPRRQKSWPRDDTAQDTGSEIITGMGSVLVYDQYWTRFNLSANATLNNNITWIGNLFSSDDDLKSEHPDLLIQSALDAFDPTVPPSTKTSWEEQAVKAAEIIIHDLRTNALIYTAGQILKRNELKLLSVAKTAQIIYGAMGEGQKEEYATAKAEYELRLKNLKLTVDEKLDGRVDYEDTVNLYQGSVSRK